MELLNDDDGGDLEMHEPLYYANYLLCLPLMLIINFSLFQYLVVTYFKRRKEWRVKLLFLSGFLSFASLVTFSYKEHDYVEAMNDISETCSALTFLIQITIIGRGVLRKVKVRSVRCMTLLSEGLILIGFVILVVNIVDLAIPEADVHWLAVFDNVCEDVGLAFVFVFRFYCTSMTRGWRRIWERQKLEVFLYFLFMTHEYPFYVLNAHTPYNWEYIQGLYMRLVMAACLSITVHQQYRSSGNSKNPTVSYQPPATTIPPLDRQQQPKELSPSAALLQPIVPTF